MPVEDAVVADPPTVDEVLEQQRREHPHQAMTSTMSSHSTEEEVAATEAGGKVVNQDPHGGPEIEGPNSA